MLMTLLLTSFWGNIMCPCHLQKQCFITKFSRFWLLIKTFPFFLPFVFPAPFVPLRSSDDNYAKKESHPYPKTSIFYWWVPCDLFLFIFRCGLITGTQSSLWGETINTYSINAQNTSCRWTYYWLPSEGICAPIICRNDVLSRNFVIPFAHQNIPFRFAIRFLCPKMNGNGGR